MSEGERVGVLRFGAPWGRPLILTSALVTGILLVVLGIGLAFRVDEAREVWLLSMVGLPALILAVMPLFTVRGYVIDGGTLRVLRLGWATELPLRGLRSAMVDPEATKKSWRTMGNGGGFAFTGYYRNKSLGDYRMFATDLKNAVVLRFEDREPIVVTPDDPEAFAAALSDGRSFS